jgi:hypothetical protein
MKKFIFLFVLFNIVIGVEAQNVDSGQIVSVLQTDGNQWIGQILSSNSREILFKTQEGRELFIPQYVISKITAVKLSEFSESGNYIGEEKFCTRYFLTTNGLPLKKKTGYIQWNLFGPDIQFSVTDKLGVGLMTSWVGIPMIATIKYSTEIAENLHIALGGLIGTGTWAAPDYGGILPFAALTLGNEKRNINFSGGYGAIWTEGDRDGRTLVSLAGMSKIGKKVSLVFDSFIILPKSATELDPFGNPRAVTKSGLAIITPGLRFHQSETSAFQFGFTGMYANAEWVPVPIPMVQWYRAF